VPNPALFCYRRGREPLAGTCFTTGDRVRYEDQSERRKRRRLRRFRCTLRVQDSRGRFTANRITNDARYHGRSEGEGEAERKERDWGLRSFASGTAFISGQGRPTSDPDPGKLSGSKDICKYAPKSKGKQRFHFVTDRPRGGSFYR